MAGETALSEGTWEAATAAADVTLTTARPAAMLRPRPCVLEGGDGVDDLGDNVVAVPSSYLGGQAGGAGQSRSRSPNHVMARTRSGQRA